MQPLFTSKAQPNFGVGCALVYLPLVGAAQVDGAVVVAAVNTHFAKVEGTGTVARQAADEPPDTCAHEVAVAQTFVAWFQ